MSIKTPYKITTLAESPELKNQVITLVEKNFGYILPHHYEVDFYPLVNEKNFSHCYVLMKDQELIGHIGVKNHELSYNEFKFTASLIGGIAIDEKFQGQGLFTDFFEEVLKKHASSALVMLWSDKHELYSKYDFYLIGNQYCYMGENNIHPHEKKLSELNDFEIKKMQNLYEKVLKEEVLHIKRTHDDWNDFKKMNSVSALLFYQDKELVGYALKNKGMDLGGIVHEYIHLDPFQHLQEVLFWGTLWSYKEFMNPNLNETKQHLALMKCNVASLKIICEQFDFFIGGVESI